MEYDAWVMSSPGVWETVSHGDTWTLTMNLKGAVTSYTLTGPHPAPTWTIGVREPLGLEHAMSRASDRIGEHYHG